MGATAVKPKEQTILFNVLHNFYILIFQRTDKISSYPIRYPIFQHPVYTYIPNYSPSTLSFTSRKIKVNLLLTRTYNAHL